MNQFNVWISLSLVATLLTTPPSLAQTSAANSLPDLLAQKRWAEALVTIDQALKARPKDTELLMNRGAVLSNLGRDGEALQVFKAVATANPKLPAAHNNMAVILAATGRYDEARTALLKAIQAQPRYATAHDNLGDLYAHQAAEAYRKALEIEPGLKAAKFKLNLTNDIITLATGVRPSGPPLTVQPPAAAAATVSAAPATAAAAATVDKAAPSSSPSPPPTPSPTLPAPKAAPALAPATAAAAATTAAPPSAPSTSTAAAPPAKAAAAEPVKPAAPSASPEPAASDIASVETAVRNWQRAWTRRDGARYVAAYAEDYRGGTDTAAIWRELAQKRLRERSNISVDIAQLQVEVDGDTAQARFEQTYQSDQPGSRMRTRKTLIFQRVGGGWLIREERRN